MCLRKPGLKGQVSTFARACSDFLASKTQFLTPARESTAAKQPSDICIMEGWDSNRQINGRSRKLTVIEGARLEVIMEMLLNGWAVQKGCWEGLAILWS